jgi:hypothetical protein
MQPTQNPPTEPIFGPDVEAVTTPAVTLRNAALYVERHGWTQSLFFDLAHDGPFPPACAMGAIRMAVYGSTSLDPDTTDVDQQALLTRANRQLAGYLDPDFGISEDDDPYSASDRIGDWNDETDRTAADVITTLREAADDWDRLHTGRYLTAYAANLAAIKSTGGDSR